MTAEVSGGHAGEEMMAWQGSYSCLEASGWLWWAEGMTSKCVRAVEGMGGELEVAKQPLQLLGRWTLVQSASNVGHCPCQRPTRLGGQRLKWTWALV